jgi:predicted CoA-binding protein
VFPIHPEAEQLDGVQCRRDFSDLPEDVDRAVLVVPPAETERLIPVAARSGIRRIWMQQGAESEQAVRLCEQHGIAEVHGECILMFAEPAGFVHRGHRWLWGLLGKLPEEA